jgi:hypothetical protein
MKCAVAMIVVMIEEIVADAVLVVIPQLVAPQHREIAMKPVMIRGTVAALPKKMGSVVAVAHHHLLAEVALHHTIVTETIKRSS